jgi:uncharacterized phage protein (TIGR01671 family)
MIFKFRGWDELEKKMYNFDLLAYMSYNEMAQDELCPFGAKRNLMQFTGFHDQEGKEIYIGDIVKLEDLDEPYEIIINDFMKIPAIDNDLGQAPLYTSYKKCRIIGNIYENPELITH